MPESQIYSVVLRGPQVGKFPAGLMPLIGPSLRRSPATFQTLGHGDLSNARSLLIAMSPLQSIAVMHPWVAAAWCRLYRTDASSASVQRVRADFAAAFVTVRAEGRAAGTRLRRRGVMDLFYLPSRHDASPKWIDRGPGASLLLAAGRRRPRRPRPWLVWMAGSAARRRTSLANVAGSPVGRRLPMLY